MPRIVTLTLNPAIDRVYLADRVKTADNALIEPIAIRPGGKGINVSRSLARLNVQSTAVAPVAFDQLDNFRAEFRDACRGLVADALLPSTAPTRHTITLLDHIDRTQTHLREPGHPIPLDTLADLEACVRRLANPDTRIAFCGSLPPALMASDISALVRACAESGAQVIVDSSGAFLDACARNPSVWLKINQRELASIVGFPINVPTDVVRAARGTRALPGILCTLAEQGCVLATPSLALHAMPPPASENPYCTVGCGDATLAGLLAANAPLDSPQALTSACAAGTSAAFSREPGTVDPALYAQLLHSVVLREVRR